MNHNHCSNKNNFLFDIVHQFAIKLPDYSNLEDAFDYMLTILLDIEEIDGAGIYILDSGSGHISLISHRGLSDEFIKNVSSFNKKDDAFRLIPETPLYNFLDILKDSSLYETIKKEKLKAIAIIPIVYEGKIISAINIASRSCESFSCSTKKLFESISGQIGSIIGTIISKSNLEKSYSIVKTILESTGDGIIVVDLQGSLLAFNENFSRMWNIPDDIIKTNSIERITEFISKKVSDSSEFFYKIKEIKSDPKSNSYDIIYLRSGQIFERYSQPHYMEGNIIGRVWNYRNITERKKIEEQKEDLGKQLAHSQKMESLGRLSASIAHDLNNLLAPIMGYSELLTKTAIKETPLYNNAEIIYETAVRAKELTQKLLTLGKKQDPDMKIVNLNSIIKSFLPIIKNSLRESIDLTLDLERELPFIKADISQLEHLILNIIINSRDAIGDEGQIIIKTRRQKDNKVSIKFIDNGKGIPDADKETVFEPFFTTKGGGTGLGLTIVYNIAKQHNAHISVESSIDKGTCFEIIFPAENKKLSIMSAVSIKENEVLYGKETILLVDDNKNIRQLANEILNQYNYKVLTASMGEEAISLAREYEGSIDLLFTDFIIPDMNGMDLYYNIKPIIPQLKVLYMSGYAEDILKKQIKKKFRDNFIQKPFSVISVARKIRDILNS